MGFLVAAIVAIAIGVLIALVNYLAGVSGGNGLHIIMPIFSFIIMVLANLHLATSIPLKIRKDISIAQRAILLLSSFSLLLIIPNTFGLIGCIFNSSYRQYIAKDGFPWWSLPLFEFINVSAILLGLSLYSSLVLGSQSNDDRK